MPTTFMSLTNTLLEDFNQSTLQTSADFDSARSVHRVAKNAINRSIDKIQSKEHTWPFNRTDGSQLLVVNQGEYSWPSDMLLPDMESFILDKDDTLGVSTTRLEQITEREWRDFYREKDLDATSTGLSVPKRVARLNNSWVVTSVPDKAYTVRFQYWAGWTRLSAHDDESTIPTQWDHVILENAKPFMHKHFENLEVAAATEKDGMDMLDHMASVLVDKEYRVFVGQLQTGGYYYVK